MSSNKKAAASPKKVTTVIANDPEDRKGMLKAIGGSRSDYWNNMLANQAVQALWLKHSDPETRDKQYSATVAALIGIAPKDELEANDGGAAGRRPQRRDGMLPPGDARRADLRGTARQPQSGEQALPHLATLLDALNSYRGKGQNGKATRK